MNGRPVRVHMVTVGEGGGSEWAGWRVDERETSEGTHGDSG